MSKMHFVDFVFKLIKNEVFSKKGMKEGNRLEGSKTKIFFFEDEHAFYFIWHVSKIPGIE